MTAQLDLVRDTSSTSISQDPIFPIPTQTIEQTLTSSETTRTTLTMPLTTTTQQIPHLRKTKTSYQLIVNSKPHLMLAAELHNSSLSSSSYMSKIYPSMRAMNINTLLGSVSWEMIEPIEGVFNFTELDACILSARENGMKLVLLWFGSFKNALSTYVPSWVKKDVRRFKRVHVLEAGGRRRTLELISPFCEEGWKADSKAFAALMGHLRVFDGVGSTVVMVQVENETGVLGDSRDRSFVAERRFGEPVPIDLLESLMAGFEGTHGCFRKRFPGLKKEGGLVPGKSTWEEVFGKGIDAEEMFMADAFSRYINHVALAGKKEYPIPFYTNVWLNFDDPSILDLTGFPIVVGGGANAGVYPSGGAVPHTFDVWRFNTKGALDFVSPDLYFHDYETVCEQYTHGGNPLFIPEQRRDERGARRIWLAYGTFGAMGVAPFGIDSLEPEDSPIRKHYGLLEQVKDVVVEAQAERPEDMMGFFFDEVEETKAERKWVKVFGEFEVTIDRSFVFGKPGPGAGLIIHQGEGKFLLVGWGFQITFKSVDPKSTFTGILYSEEKVVGEDGKLKTGRVLNGDETRSGAFMIMPNEDPDYGGFPIAVTIPCKTMIAECTAYSVAEEEDF